MNVKQVSERLKHHTARIATYKLKEIFSDETGTFICSWECRDDHDLQ